MKTKLQYFPVTVFSMVMGLTGFTISLGKFYHLQWLPEIFYEAFLFLSFILFIFLIILYGFKLIYFPEEVKSDFNHRIRINFFSTISISLILLSIAFYSYYPILSLLLWWIGTILHTILLFITVRFWIDHNFEIHHFNPAWFIPAVGSILIPITGVDLLPAIILYFYFAVGFFFWIILFTIFLYRVIFHPQLPGKFIPTFFILLAPPAVGFISYIRIAASWDTFSVFLLFMTYFFLVLLAFMYKSFRSLNYFLSWWAFTFPLSASTIASVVAYQVTKYAAFKYISFLLLIITTIAVTIVAWHTVIQIQKGEICINED